MEIAPAVCAAGSSRNQTHAGIPEERPLRIRISGRQNWERKAPARADKVHVVPQLVEEAPVSFLWQPGTWGSGSSVLAGSFPFSRLPEPPHNLTYLPLWKERGACAGMHIYVCLCTDAYTCVYSYTLVQNTTHEQLHGCKSLWPQNGPHPRLLLQTLHVQDPRDRMFGTSRIALGRKVGVHKTLGYNLPQTLLTDSYAYTNQLVN